MFVAASAIIAIPVRADDAEELAARLGSARRRLTSAIADYEVVTALVRLRQGPVERARIIVGEFLDRNAIAHVNIGRPKRASPSTRLTATARADTRRG